MMTTRLFRTLVIGVLLVGLAGMRPLPSFAVTTVCPTTEDALSTAIASAGNGGTVTFNCPSPTTIHFGSGSGSTGTITLTQDVTLDANSSIGAVTFDGDSNTELFSVPPPVTLTLKGLTLANGNAPRGGAIYNGGTLTITNSTLSGNSASNGFGGAIGNAGTLSITNSTLSGNSAVKGGAIGNAGRLTITSSTLSGNSAANTGGAIYTNGGTASVGASIIANSRSGGNCFGTITDLGYNLTDSNGNCGLTGSTDHQNTDPKFVTDGSGSPLLADNGGHTQTIALRSGSLAIDQIPADNALCASPATDQRGVPRPMGAKCDIGAYEYAGGNGAFMSGCLYTTAKFRAALIALANGGVIFFTCSSDETLYTAADAGGTFSIANELAVVGNGGPGKVTLDGNGTDRIFSVSSGVTFGLSYLTLQHGNGSDGGAIDNFGTVTIANSILSGNSSSFGSNGGAVFNENGGTLSITSSTLSGNSASGGSGGAIENAGTMSIANSTLSGNSAHSGGNSGAIVNVPGGTLSIATSTLSGNSADFTSGAITNATGGTLSITNSTLSGNSVGANGSGAITNSPGGTVKVGGSIVAKNPTGGNCAGTVTDQGYNLEDTSQSTCGFSAISHDLVGSNPQLGPLQNNGGPTSTMALAPTSPAIDRMPAGQAGCPSSGTSTDQRGPGYARPDNGESTCDIGAYEFQNDTTTTLTSSANPSASGQPVTFTATVSTTSTAGTPTGTVQFSVDGKTFGSAVPLSGGKATSQSISSLAPGSHTIRAAYTPYAPYLPSSGSLTQTVNVSHLTGALSSSFRPIEGRAYPGPVAAFTDTDSYISASQLTATIGWGDGTSSSGTVSGSAGHFVVSGSRSYADEGSQRVSVTLQEQTPGKASGTATGTEAVAEGDQLTPSTTTAPPATASRSYSGVVASFSDSDTANIPRDFTATINWGDGTSSAGTVSGSNGHLTVSGSHTYPLAGRYTVQTTIRDDAPGTASATATTSLLVMVPASSSGITIETNGTTDCTSVASSTKVTSAGAPSGTLAFRDERPGGSPCGAYRAGVLTLQAIGIDAVVCTSHSTASIYGRATEGTYPNSSASMVSFRADVAITSQSVPFNGTVRVQASSGYTSGAVPASIHITGC